MYVDELLVKDSHSYQDYGAGWVGFASDRRRATVMAPQRMTAGMKDYWYYLVEMVGMEASILPSEDSVARFVSDWHFVPCLGEAAVNWKVCRSHYFEAC